MKRTICILLLASLIMFSCKRKELWDNAKIENSISSYENYLKQYSSGRFSDSAKFYIEVLIWKETSKRDSISAYEEYLKQYPEGKFSDSANFHIEELIWDKTSKENNISAYEEYLKQYPEGHYLDSARLLRAAITVTESPNNIAGLEILSVNRKKIIAYQPNYNFSFESRHKKGNWLVVTVLVTPPRKDFSLIPTISASIPDTTISPFGIGGVKGDESVFLEYTEVRSLPTMTIIVAGGSNWGAMYKNGWLVGAGYLDSEGKEHLFLSLNKLLKFPELKPIRISLVFDVTNVQGPYILNFVDTHVK